MEVCDGLAPALKYVGDLKDQAHAAEAPKIVPLPLEPEGHYGLWKPHEKTFEIRVAATPPREYRAGSVEAVVKMLDEFMSRKAHSSSGDINLYDMAFVFVQDGLITAVLNETHDRKERVTFSLTMAPAFRLLRKMAEHPYWAGQKATIDLLRTELNAKYVPDNIVTTLRTLKFNSDASGESVVKTGKESMGRQVEAKIAGLDGGELDALENVLVTLPVYTDLLDPAREYRVIEFSVDCAFDVDVTENKFRLKPKAGEIERVLLEADRRIMNDIDANLKDRTRVRVFRGAPKN